MHRNPIATFVLLAVGLVLLFTANLLWGSVPISLHETIDILFHGGEGTTLSTIHRNIILSSRLPQALTAVMAGAGLAVSGLQMQTVFHNPLAGPSVLGITSGLGSVALSSLGFLGNVALTTAAILGSMATLLLMTLIARRVENTVTLLIIGVMIGYVANAAIGVLKFFANDDDVREYVIWGLGSFSRVSGDEVTLFVSVMAILLPLTFFSPQFGIEHSQGACSGHSFQWHCRSHRHCLLRSYSFHWSGRTSFVPWSPADRQPPFARTGLPAHRSLISTLLQSARPHARL